MLFARFLAENHLLMNPDVVAVSLAECEVLAPSEDAANGFVLAARYASRMLPQIFRTDDVLLEIEFPANDRIPLEKLLATKYHDFGLVQQELGHHEAAIELLTEALKLSPDQPEWRQQLQTSRAALPAEEKKSS